ncbi:MAG TPA: 2-amino-4-oxopentanoate thiolase subunit OrtA [Thermoleophilia bacterium]|nr:2-amino-4-oxopentanoate thiolase subunit OrtA [Thermoleophilia bacterium]
MTDATHCTAGDWVEVERVLLEPADRSKNLPPETAGKPLSMWVKGFAQSAAAVGEEVTVETMSGRLVSGRLFAVDPGYFHTFGRPIPELTHVGRDVRAQLAQYRAAQGHAGGSAGADEPADAAGGR